LCSTFVVPTKALVLQTYEELRTRIPDVQIGLYYGERSQPVSSGVNITTYATLQRHFYTCKLPEPIVRSALIFLDEAHHAMTFKRIEALNKAFMGKSIRIAVTATPDYNGLKQLHRFFPVLIHELELIDAFELGLLAPARMWVVEVDADASTVRFIAGDYEQETMGRLMSSSPFFKAVQVFRYTRSNANVPALITCSSRQQAYDLWNYLKKHKPGDRSVPGLILGETPGEERKRLLADFENGRVDTLIQVGVLIEGWNSPRCKLLLDLAPSLSRVRATQKYFRVMTRYGNDEARIVVILPSRLPRQPILPVDLILQPGEKYVCGDLIDSSPDVNVHNVASAAISEKSPVKSVKIKSRVIASASLMKPRLESDNPNQIRSVLASCPGFNLNLVGGSVGFSRLFFNHELFVGSGSMLLRYLGIVNGKEYTALLARLFPEEILLMQEQLEIIFECMQALNPREKEILINRLELFGSSQMTFTELGDRFGVSLDRIRQIFWKAKRKLARKYLIKTGDRQPIVKDLFEYPDFYDLLART
jgi:RNA polymerase sigma factor (sigma-70 family)